MGAVNHAGTLEFRYDASGRLIEERSAVAGGTLALAHTYDEMGNRVRTTLPDGRNLNWLHYGSGHLHQINVDGDVIADMERDALHREVARTQGLLESRFHYDRRGRLASQHVRRSSPMPGVREGQAVPVSRFGQHDVQADGFAVPSIARNYQYDQAGNPLAVHDARFGKTIYAYDAIGRLRQANDERFAFDPASNILDATPQPVSAPGKVAEAPSWPVDSDDRLHPFDVPPDPPAVAHAVVDNRVRFYDGQRCVYDAHGNLIERRIGQHVVMRFDYDPLHRMTSAEVTRQGVTQRYRYLYDAMNRRVGKCDVFGMTRFVWDADRLLAETRGQRTRVYVYGEAPYVPVAQIESRVLNGQLSSSLFHYHVDHIGTPREMTDHDGQLVWRAGGIRSWSRTRKRCLAASP